MTQGTGMQISLVYAIKQVRVMCGAEKRRLDLWLCWNWAAPIHMEPLEDNNPGTILLLPYLPCSPPMAFCEVSYSLGRSKSGNMLPIPIVFKRRGKICQALLSNLLVGVLLNWGFRICLVVWLASIEREPTNIQKLFKNMCDLVCTIWPIQQKPYVNHLKKTGLEHASFLFL